MFTLRQFTGRNLFARPQHSFASQGFSRGGGPLSAALLSLVTLSACAVGPDFLVPPPPPVAGYTPEGKPAATESADVAGGAMKSGPTAQADSATSDSSAAANGLPTRLKPCDAKLCCGRADRLRPVN